MYAVQIQIPCSLNYDGLVIDVSKLTNMCMNVACHKVSNVFNNVKVGGLCKQRQHMDLICVYPSSCAL